MQLNSVLLCTALACCTFILPCSKADIDQINSEFFNQLIPVYGYWVPSLSSHYYTTNDEEFGIHETGQIKQVNNADVVAQGIIFDVATVHKLVLGSKYNVALYSYWSSEKADLLLTTDPEEIGTTTVGETKSGYTYQGILGYVFDEQYSGTIPLYRFYSSVRQDHFYTTEDIFLKMIPIGYTYQGIECFVLIYH